jgi:predicted ATPase with chaperone activity
LELAAPGQMYLSARGYYQVLKLARTIANLADALHYKPKLIWN